MPRSSFNPRATQVSGEALGGVLGTNFSEFLICDDLGLWLVWFGGFEVGYGCPLERLFTNDLICEVTGRALCCV